MRSDQLLLYSRPMTRGSVSSNWPPAPHPAACALPSASCCSEARPCRFRAPSLHSIMETQRLEPACWPAMLRDSGNMGRHRHDLAKRHLISDINSDIQAFAGKMVAQHVRPLHQADGRLQRLRPAYPLQVQGTVQAVQVEVVDRRPCTWWSLWLGHAGE